MRSTKKFIETVASVVACVAFFLFSYSCKDDFTHDAKYRLSFSMDTLKIDTVFSESLTPTNAIMVYNHTEEDILVNSVWLESEHHYFQINVNGKSGSSFSDVKLMSGDSLFIFVQAVIKELGINTPLYIEDKIKFAYNGNTQEVVLTAYGQDAYHIKRPLHIDQNTIWSTDKPYLIYDSVIVDSAMTWQLQPGTRLYMKKEATLVVKGTAKMEGTIESPIILRTYRNDAYSSKYKYDQLADQWGGIQFTASSTGNIIRNTVIRGGHFGILVDSSEIKEEGYRLLIANSEIHNVNQTCLKAHHANILAYNSLFTNGQNGCLVLSCGDYRFDHCTIVSYLKGMGYYNKAITLSSVGFVEESNKELQIPVTARFNNCIIAGSAQDELLFMKAEEEAEGEFNYLFDHCLLNDRITEAEDTVHLNQVINEKPMFVLADDKLMLYDFHLQEESPCKEAGDLGLVLKNEYCKSDKDGIVRNIEAAPDLGAYQIIPTAEEETTENQ